MSQFFIIPPNPLDLRGGNPAQSWEKWKRRFEIYLQAIDSTQKSDKQKIGLLLNHIGDEGIDIYSNFSFFFDEDRSNYETVIKKYNEHFIKRYPELVLRERFWLHLARDPEQNFYSWVNTVKERASECNFPYDFQEQAIRDKLIFSCTDNEVKLKLYDEGEYLSLQKTIHVLSLREATRRELEESRLKIMNCSMEISGHTLKHPTQNETFVQQVGKCYNDSLTNTCTKCHPRVEEMCRTFQEVVYPTTVYPDHELTLFKEVEKHEFEHQQEQQEDEEFLEGVTLTSLTSDLPAAVQIEDSHDKAREKIKPVEQRDAHMQSVDADLSERQTVLQQSRLRKRIPVRYFSDDSSDEEISKKKSKRTSGASDCSSGDEDLPNLTEPYEELSTSSQKPRNDPTSRTVSYTPVSDSSPQHMDQTPVMSSASTTNLPQQKEMKDNQNNSLLNVLRAEVDELKRQLHTVKEKHSTHVNEEVPSEIHFPLKNASDLVNKELPGGICFPLKDISSLDDLEREMEDSDIEDKIIAYLCTIKGANFKEFLNNVLHQIFDDSLAMKCNWSGKGARRAFRTCRLRNSVIRTIHRQPNFKNISTKLIETLMKKWFQLARKRIA